MITEPDGRVVRRGTQYSRDPWFKTRLGPNLIDPNLSGLFIHKNMAENHGANIQRKYNFFSIWVASLNGLYSHTYSPYNYITLLNELRHIKFQYIFNMLNYSFVSMSPWCLFSIQWRFSRSSNRGFLLHIYPLKHFCQLTVFPSSSLKQTYF